MLNTKYCQPHLYPCSAMIVFLTLKPLKADCILVAAALTAGSSRSSSSKHQDVVNEDKTIYGKPDPDWFNISS